MVQGLDRHVVEEVVKKDLNSDAAKVDQAVSSWFDGTGPFKDAENNKAAWKTGGSKQKGRKGDEDAPAPKQDDARGRGAGKGAGKGESRGRGDSDRGRGRGRGRGREGLPASERPPRDGHQSGKGERAEAAAALQNGNGGGHATSAEATPPPAPADAPKTFTSAKQPAVSAWSRPKDWSAELAPELLKN